MTDAERLADAILRAAGSGLRNYTRPEPIIAAAQAGIDDALERAATVCDDRSVTYSNAMVFLFNENDNVRAGLISAAREVKTISAAIRAMKWQAK